MNERYRLAFYVTAYHEAGHAVFAHLLGLILDGIDLRWDHDSFGRAKVRAFEGEPPQGRIWVDRLTLTSLAGPVAEGCVTGHDAISKRPADDEDWGIPLKLVMDNGMTRDEAETYMVRMLTRARKLMYRPTRIWAAIDSLATVSLKKVVLDRGEATAVIEAIIPRRAHLG